MSRRLLLGVALLVLGAVGSWLYARRGAQAGGDHAGGAAAVADDSARAPAGVRVQVEVLNASGVRGLARRATMHLRDLGYDVVSSGNAAERLDSTLVLVRRGDETLGARLGRAMGGARVEARPDSSRYVDLSVLVGREWRPPPGPLRP